MSNVDYVEALRHHSGTVIGGDRIGEVFIEHRELMAWAAEEIERLRAENDAYKADIEAGRMVRLENCAECRYKLQSQAWTYYTYPCSECRQRVKSNFMRMDARAAQEKGAPNETH